MIGMMKKAFPWKTKKKQIVYNAFRPYGGDGILRIKKAQNCAFSNGTLQTGLAIEPCFSLAGNVVDKVNYSNAIAVWPLRFLQEDGITLKEQISVLSNTGFLYFYDETTKTLTNKIRPGDQTNAVYLRTLDHLRMQGVKLILLARINLLHVLFSFPGKQKKLFLLYINK